MPNKMPVTKMTGNSASQLQVKVLGLALGALLQYTAQPTIARGDCFPQAPLGAIIPLYIYPTPEAFGMPHAWQHLFDVRNKYPNLAIWAILSPSVDEAACRDKMPGCKCSTFDSNYDASVGLLKAHAIRMLGYVPTGHGNINDPSLRECMRENIDTWQKHVDDYAKEPGHPPNEAVIEGIFFDEMDTAKAQAVFYAELSEYARDGMHSFKYTVGNPGDMPTQEVADSVVTVVIYEKAGFPSPCFLDGTCAPNPLPAASSRGKFAIQFHSTPSVPTASEIHTAAQHVRFVYGTDATDDPATSGDETWITFPSYLEQLFALLQAENDSSSQICLPTIPATSKWGEIILAVLLLTTGSILLRRGRRAFR